MRTVIAYPRYKQAIPVGTADSRGVHLNHGMSLDVMRKEADRFARMLCDPRDDAKLGNKVRGVQARASEARTLLGSNKIAVLVGWDDSSPQFDAGELVWLYVHDSAVYLVVGVSDGAGREP